MNNECKRLNLYRLVKMLVLTPNWHNTAAGIITRNHLKDIQDYIRQTQQYLQAND